MIEGNLKSSEPSEKKEKKKKTQMQMKRWFPYNSDADFLPHALTTPR
jgi:hypothetical protein